jgi:hypothetical protein
MVAQAAAAAVRHMRQPPAAAAVQPQERLWAAFKQHAARARGMFTMLTGPWRLPWSAAPNVTAPPFPGAANNHTAPPPAVNATDSSAAAVLSLVHLCSTTPVTVTGPGGDVCGRAACVLLSPTASEDSSSSREAARAFDPPLLWLVYEGLHLPPPPAYHRHTLGNLTGPTLVSVAVLQGVLALQPACCRAAPGVERSAGLQAPPPPSRPAYACCRPTGSPGGCGVSRRALARRRCSGRS